MDLTVKESDELKSFEDFILKAYIRSVEEKAGERDIFFSLLKRATGGKEVLIETTGNFKKPDIPSEIREK